MNNILESFDAACVDYFAYTSNKSQKPMVCVTFVRIGKSNSENIKKFYDVGQLEKTRYKTKEDFLGKIFTFSSSVSLKSASA